MGIRWTVVAALASAVAACLPAFAEGTIPAGARVSRERAIEIARDRVNEQGLLVIGEPRLFDGRDGLVWNVTLGCQDAWNMTYLGSHEGYPYEYTVTIDARSGRVREYSPCACMRPPGWRKVPIRRYPRWLPPAGAVAGATLLAAGALAVVRRRACRRLPPGPQGECRPS